jgi:apolipoprotein N-acyltransferase
MRLRGAILLCALSGGLLALSFPAAGLWFLAWVALVPWLVSLRLGSGWGAALGSLAGGFVFYGILLYWLGLFGWTVWALACLFLSLTLLLWGLGARWIGRLSPGLRTVGAAVLWCAVEWGRGLGQFGFTWGWLGYSQTPAAFVLPVARSAGTIGISFLIALVNAALAEAVVGAMQEEGARLWLGRAVVVLGAVVAVVLGAQVLDERQPRLAGPHLRVAIIQGNATGPLVAANVNVPMTQEEHARTRQTYLSLTAEAARARPSLVVWPESALPGAPESEPLVAETAARAARVANAWLLAGGPYQDGPRQLNSAYLYAPSGHLVARYDKVQLVPFGEYVPARGRIPFLDRYQVRNVDFSPGAVHHVLQAGTVSLGPMICFESIFPEISWQLVRRGAQVLVIMTNDAWFGRTAAAAQHQQIAVMRALEANRWVVRAASTGISCFISPEGKVVSAAGLFESKVLTQDITLAPEGARRPGPAQTLAWAMVFLALAFLIAPAALPPSVGARRRRDPRPRRGEAPPRGPPRRAARPSRRPSSPSRTDTR